ncbi:MAG: recombinase family protein [Acetobacter peroxydans]|jgi:DNA invertase Pin-like site-specific DNA recombinase|nr:recombinase family protein [Acetobacter peroxydans]
MLYGYARVSTSRKDEEGFFVQTTSSQIESLINAGVDSSNIFGDRVSGKEKNRPGLDALLAKVRSGDVIVVWKLDRLGRSVRNLLELAEILKSKRVTIRSISDGIDTGGALGGFLMTILGAVAELERENIVERVKSGLQAAKNRGIHVGRRRALSQQACKDILNSIKCGERVSDIARRYSVSRATVYRSIDRI